MGTRFTRRRFLTAVGRGASYLALASIVGCGRLERSSEDSSLRTPRAGPLRTPEVMLLPGAASRPPKEVWAFHSRPDLSPPAVTVTTQAHSQAPGYIFVAPNRGGTGQGGPMIVDDRGEVVWFRPHQGMLDLMAQTYRGERVLTWVEAPGQFVIFDDSYREVARF